MTVIDRDIVTQIIKNKYLDRNEILLLIGARQAGKTTILRILQKKITEKGLRSFFLNLEDPDYLHLLNQSPKNLFQILPIDLNTKTAIFIDEIQYLKNPTNFLKYLFDEYQDKIKLIVSGSSAFYLDRKFRDSLVGRKIVLLVQTLSFREFLRFKNEKDLSELLPESFNPANFKLEHQVSLLEKEQIKKYFYEFMLFGGYPKVVLSSATEKINSLQEITYSYIKKDVYEADIKQDEVFYRLFKILASTTGSLVNSNELSNTLGVSRKTINNYLYVMQKSFHICLLRPFYHNSRKELTKMPKIFFYDLGLRNFLINNFESPELRLDRGELLENVVFRQLADLSQMLPNEHINFWRTQIGAEVDFIYKDEYAFEVKYDTNLFKRSKYGLFLEKYPKIKFNLVSLNKSGKADFPVWKPWWL